MTQITIDLKTARLALIGLLNRLHYCNVTLDDYENYGVEDPHWTRAVEDRNRTIKDLDALEKAINNATND